MAIYHFPSASPALRRAVNGLANIPGDIYREASVPSQAELLRQGVRSESRIDIRFADAGEYLNTSAGDVVSVHTAAGENVFLTDVGNGAHNLLVLGLPGGVSPVAVAEATHFAPETQVAVAGVNAETQAGFMVPQDAYAGPQGGEAQLVNQEDNAAYWASLTGGGGGALGAAGVATYGTYADEVPVYEPYYAPVYETYYAPAVYAPSVYEAAYYEPQPVYYQSSPGYEEWAQTQTDLEQLVAMGLY
jgi:hypothetical protein